MGRRSYREMRQRPLWMCACLLSSCSSAPSHPILGSYFPSWMFCALAGLGVAALLRQLFAALGIDRALPAPLVVYLALATAAAFATWLIWLDQPLRG
jgi:hypothetical protein